VTNHRALAPPLISVIMPVRNEAAFIRRSLGSVLAQDYPPNRFEVLVADGQSTDGTCDVVRSFMANRPNLRVVENPGRIVSAGFNAALREAKGEIIVRVDGHTEIAADYLSQCVAELQRTGAGNVGGRMIAVGTGPFGRAVAAVTGSPFGVGGSRFHYSELEEWVDTVYMGAWPCSVFDEVGLLDEELVRDQDDEFNYRLRAHGKRILLSPRIRSVYTTRSTPMSLWRQYFEYGYWKVRVTQMHPGQMRLRHFVPPAFVLALLVSSGLAASGRAGWFLGALAAAYLVCSMVASLALSPKVGWTLMPAMPVAFAIIHVGYGAGFLYGLIRFLNRWRDGGVMASAKPKARVDPRRESVAGAGSRVQDGASER